MFNDKSYVKGSWLLWLEFGSAQVIALKRRTISNLLNFWYFSPLYIVYVETLHNGHNLNSTDIYALQYTLLVYRETLYCVCIAPYTNAFIISISQHAYWHHCDLVLLHLVLSFFPNGLDIQSYLAVIRFMIEWLHDVFYHLHTYITAI